MLSNDDRWVRKDAADGLSAVGPAAAKTVPALIEMLRDADKDVREAAAEALRKIRG